MTVLDQEGINPLMLDIAPGTGLPDLSAVRQDVDAALATFLDTKEHEAPGLELHHLIGTLRMFLEDGKRLRPLLCVCGWYAAGGRGEVTSVIRAAAGLELFQAFALIHDDVMDGSDVRRGRPSAHRALAAAYAANGGPGSRADAHGLGAAILLGDLALVWSDELFHTAGLTLSQLAQALPVVDLMRSEVVYGQFADLQATGRLSSDVEAALRVVRYKTAKYTVERPLHLGAVLAGASAAVLEACTAFALPLGEAFQLRDDLLGVFGDPAQTGKPTLDDLREGKATVLMALGLRQASPSDARTLRALVGRADLSAEQAAGIRTILDASGARQTVEEMISMRRELALAALDQAPFPAPAQVVLREIARTATVRQS